MRMLIFLVLVGGIFAPSAASAAELITPSWSRDEPAVISGYVRSNPAAREADVEPSPSPIRVYEPEPPRTGERALEPQSDSGPFGKSGW